MDNRSRSDAGYLQNGMRNRGKRISTQIPMTVGIEEIRTKGHVKYLDITLDTKQTFWPHKTDGRKGGDENQVAELPNGKHI